jgi:hypothetical protein
VVQIPNVFPWPLKAESSLLLGWIFYGIAVYFVYALLFSQWGYDTGPLLGLTANALVMLGPLIMQLKTAADAQLPGLIAYLVILIAGLLLACYFLFIHRSTRFWGRRVLRKAISE